MLDNPNKNDYELGNVDHFDSAEDGLGDCLNFPFPSTNADLRVFMQHSGSDAWYGEKIIVYSMNQVRHFKAFTFFCTCVRIGRESESVKNYKSSTLKTVESRQIKWVTVVYD